MCDVLTSYIIARNNLRHYFGMKYNDLPYNFDTLEFYWRSSSK